LSKDQEDEECGNNQEDKGEDTDQNAHVSCSQEQRGGLDVNAQICTQNDLKRRGPRQIGHQKRKNHEKKAYQPNVQRYS